MSSQNTETPKEFVKSIERLFGIKFEWDLAASPENAKAPKYFTESDNSIEIDWPRNTWCFLNPTFRNVGDWADKCQEESQKGSLMFSIWPLSSDKNMIGAWKHADIFPIHGRIWPLVRSCMLCRWGLPGKQVIHPLHWRAMKTRPDKKQLYFS